MGKFAYAGARGMTKGELLESQYRGARGNFLLAIILTVMNCVLLAIGGSWYFPFSVSFPYEMIGEGAFWTGLMFTEEEYAQLEIYAEDMLPMAFLYVMIVVALISLAGYLLCWLLSKKHGGFLIAATVFYVLDTLFLLFWYGISVSCLLDYICHAWVLFVLIRGSVAYFKLKEMERTNAAAAAQSVPSQEPGAVIDGDAATVQDPTQEPADEPVEEQPEEVQESPALHAADFTVKSRTLLEYREQKYDICYRRVGKVNELVINGMVYDLLDTGPMEYPHELCAIGDGHEIAAGFGSDSHTYIRFDGEVLKRKMRWI